MPDQFSSIKFGTSGLRGPADDFTPELVSAYVGAFLDYCGGKNSQVFVGVDLRASSRRIAAAVCATATEMGYRPVYCGALPTPALALHSMALAAPGIMVTGSHIPDTFNGIKFYRPNSELLKDDEGPVRDLALKRWHAGVKTQTPAPLAAPDPSAVQCYTKRYVEAFPPDALSGLKIGVDQHSAVGRDILIDVLRALGAQVIPYRRLDYFLAVDTEALPAGDITLAREQIREHGLDAVVSTDGDGDRPLLLDAAGRQINGDVLGALTARALDIGRIVTPLTSTTGIEQSGWFDQVVRTKIGSPYVVGSMAQVQGEVAGFEANGGFLLGTDIRTPSGSLSALPTRDALLPLIAVLAAARAANRTVAQLVGELPARFMKADRLKDTPSSVSQRLLSDLAHSRDARAALHPSLAEPDFINSEDGVRLHLAGGQIVHFRASGNAPELRCYVETADEANTEQSLATYMKALSDHVSEQQVTDA